MSDLRDEDTAGTDSTHTHRPVGTAGASVEGYRLLERVGEGGMGEVWLAEQVRPLRRQVALKLIKPGLDTGQVVARFDRERQALALMDHPAIAKIFDAGSTEAGRPYFAMEYVRGESITAYADGQGLSIRERLDLFVRVCEGVQHAHQKGIIHRDLKPSNILVTLLGDRPVPKIIDFGVAKAVSQAFTEHTLHTSLAGFVGTADYMSPEQADMSGADVDTRTDVYALGVVLYELLAGVRPFDRKTFVEGGLDHMRRMIREVEPPRPSTRVTGDASADTARHRRTEAARLARLIRGDLDWICLKALEKDRTRRYGSASELAADIQRHLTNQPVSAGPPSAAYRARKFVARHRFGVATGAVLIVLILSSAIALAVQARRVAGERDRANREADAAKQISSFLTGLFEVSRPSEATANRITAREVLDRGAERIRLDEHIQPTTRTMLLGTIGDVYNSLGSYERARALLEQALGDSRRINGPRSAETAQASFRLGRVLRRQGKLTEAETVLRDALDIRRAVFGSQHPGVTEVQTELGTTLADKADYAAAKVLLEDTLRVERERGPGSEIGTAKTLSALARVFFEEGDVVSAEKTFREAMELRRRVQGPSHPDTIGQMQNVATMVMMRGDYATAETLYRQAREEMARTLGSEHAEMGTLWNNVGAVQFYQRKYSEAENSYRQALKIWRATLGEVHESVGSAVVNTGQALHAQGRFEEAEVALRDGVDILRRALSPDHPMAVPGLAYLARAQLALRRVPEAERTAREALALASKAYGAEHPKTQEAEGTLAKVLISRRQWAEAEPMQLRYVAALETGSGAEGDRTDAIEDLVKLYTGWGKPKDAAVWRTKLHK